MSGLCQMETARCLSSFLTRLYSPSSLLVLLFLYTSRLLGCLAAFVLRP